MYLDNSSVLSNAQAITVTAVSTNVYDTAGLGVGQPVTNRFGTPASFGQDVGGGGPGVSSPQLFVGVTKNFTAAGAATLRVQLQAAVDVTNSGNPVTWDVIDQTDDIPVADLTLNPGQPLVSFNIPDRYQGQNFPRFYRLNYIVSTGPMTAGAVTAAFVTGIDDVPFYPPNY